MNPTSTNRIPQLLLSFAIFIAGSSHFDQEPQQQISIRFVDSKGDPVDGVRAFRFQNGKSKVIETTSGNGKAPAAEGLIVARKDGFQFSGALLSGTTNEATVVMLRLEESGKVLKTQPVPFTQDTKQQVIDAIKADSWKVLKTSAKDPSAFAASVEVLSRLAPEDTMKHFEENPAGKRMDGMVKQQLINGLAKTDIERAIEIIDSVGDPMIRATLLGSLLDKTDPKSEISIGLETELTDTIKNIPNPMLKLAIWASLARHYCNTDRAELAQKIVDLHLEDVKKLPAGGWSGFPRSLFAALIVEKEPELAAQLIQGLNRNESHRALGRLAFHCCRTNPKLAVQFLNQQKLGPKPITLADHHIKVCHRMAIEQTDAAFELAASIEEPNQRAWAYGMIAKRLNDKDPDRAKQALSIAAKTLANCTAEDDSRFSASSTTAGLLAVAEQIDPSKIQGLIWQSVYLAIPRSRWNTGGTSKVGKRQTAAAGIARYDVSISQQLAGKGDIEVGGDVTKSASNQVALNPEDLPDFLQRLSKARYSGAFHPKRVAADLLTCHKDEFWNTVSKPTFLKWPTQTFDDQ